MNRTSLQPLSTGGKVAQGVQVLSELARKLGPGSKLPTVRDLCKQMQVSRVTLDAALNDLELRGLLNRKHGSGLYVSEAVGMRRIGLVTSRLVMTERSPDMFYHLLMDSLGTECRKRNDLLTYYVYDSEHDRTGHGPQHLQFDVENKRVDGLVMAGLNHEQADQVQAMGVPNVTFCESLARVPRVEINVVAMIRQGVRLLAQRGHRRIALIYPNFERVWEMVPYVEEFQQVVCEEGARTQAKWHVAFDVDNTLVRPLEVARWFHRMWEDADRPDALLSLNDQCTAGVLHAAELLGVRIPQDLLVVSHANAGADLFHGAEIIRIECDPAVIAQACLKTLDELLDGKSATPVRSVSLRIRMPGEISGCDGEVAIGSR